MTAGGCIHSCWGGVCGADTAVVENEVIGGGGEITRVGRW